MIRYKKFLKVFDYLSENPDIRIGGFSKVEDDEPENDVTTFSRFRYNDSIIVYIDAVEVVTFYNSLIAYWKHKTPKEIKIYVKGQINNILKDYDTHMYNKKQEESKRIMKYLDKINGDCDDGE